MSPIFDTRPKSILLKSRVVDRRSIVLRLSSFFFILYIFDLCSLVETNSIFLLLSFMQKDSLGFLGKKNKEDDWFVFREGQFFFFRSIVQSIRSLYYFISD